MAFRCISAGILFTDVACWPIDHVPEQGEVVQAKSISLLLGGNAANIALDLSRLGVPVALSGCVGDEGLSDFILNAVAVDGVDCRGIQRISGYGPGTSLHINVVGEDRRFVCTTGANDFYVFDEYMERLIAAPDPDGLPRVLSLSGMLMLAALETPETPRFLERARKAGWTTVLDVVLYGKRSYWDAIEPLLPQTDVFMPNDVEAEKLSGKSDPAEQAAFFLRHGCQSVVITQGEKGTFYADRTKRFRTPVFPMECVSGAGSGDAFAAGYIAALLEGHEPEECVRWGSAVGASAVRGLSTTESVFTRTELLDFLLT